MLAGVWRAAAGWSWWLVRLGVTVACVTLVVRQIQWQDRVVIPALDTAAAPQVFWGWQQVTSSGPVLVTDAGVTLPLPADVNASAASQTTPQAPNLAGGHKHTLPDTPTSATTEGTITLHYYPGFVTLLKNIRWGWLVLALIAFPVSIGLLAIRWQWLLRSHQIDPGFLETLQLTWLGMLANNVLPGSTGGDAVKAVFIYRQVPRHKLAAVVTVLLDRVLGLISLMAVGGLGLVALELNPTDESIPRDLQAPTRLVLITLLAVLGSGVVYFSGRIRRLIYLDRIVTKLPNKLQEIDAAVFLYRFQLVTLVKCVTISLVVHFWVIGCAYLLGLAMNLEVGFIYYLAFLPVILTVAAVIPAIAGLGVMEAGFQQLFSLPWVGVSPSASVALCILYRAMILLGSLPGAIPAFTTHRLSAADVVSTATTSETPTALQPESPATATPSTMPIEKEPAASAKP